MGFAPNKKSHDDHSSDDHKEHFPANRISARRRLLLAPRVEQQALMFTYQNETIFRFSLDCLTIAETRFAARCLTAIHWGRCGDVSILHLGQCRVTVSANRGATYHRGRLGHRRCREDHCPEICARLLDDCMAACAGLDKRRRRAARICIDAAAVACKVVSVSSADRLLEATRTADYFFA